MEVDLRQAGVASTEQGGHGLETGGSFADLEDQTQGVVHVFESMQSGEVGDGSVGFLMRGFAFNQRPGGRGEPSRVGSDGCLQVGDAAQERDDIVLVGALTEMNQAHE